MNRVIYFEIPSDNPEVSMQFYGNTFGWQFQQFGNQSYWSIHTGNENEPGINGGIMKKNHPQQPVTNSIGVADIDAAIEAIEKNGGTVVVPKMAIPTVGWLAFFKDPDQNIFGVTQLDPAVK